MKIALITALMLITFKCSSQIEIQNKPRFKEITKVKQGMLFHSSLSYYNDSNSTDTTYSIIFRDNQYTQITSYGSINHTGALNELYELFAGRLKEDVDAEMNVKVGEKELYIVTRKSMGVKYIYVFVGKAYFALTENTLSKLFNKRQNSSYNSNE